MTPNMIPLHRNELKQISQARVPPSIRLLLLTQLLLLFLFALFWHFRKLLTLPPFVVVVAGSLPCRPPPLLTMIRTGPAVPGPVRASPSIIIAVRLINRRDSRYRDYNNTLCNDVPIYCMWNTMRVARGCRTGVARGELEILLPVLFYDMRKLFTMYLQLWSVLLTINVSSYCAQYFQQKPFLHYQWFRFRCKLLLANWTLM